jgi:hypothetical protein
MAEIITDDISIYKDGSWKSIKNQQAYVNGSWQTIGDGSGVYKDGNWYVFNMVYPLTFEVTINAINKSMPLPLSGISATIDWGDDVITNSTSNFPRHTYSANGTYNVKVTGTVKAITMPTTSSDLNKLKSNLTRIISWGKLDGLISMENAISNLSGITSIPDDDYGCFENVETFRAAFSNTGINSIPPNLFKYATNTTNRFNFFSTFSGCPNLTSIPEGLFKNCTNMSNCYYTFNSCTNLRSIPSDLFRYNPNIVTFGYCFLGCTKLTGTTPTDADGGKLWQRAGKTGYPSSINGELCFKNCTGLSDYSAIPSNWK